MSSKNLSSKLQPKEAIPNKAKRKTPFLVRAAIDHFHQRLGEQLIRIFRAENINSSLIASWRIFKSDELNIRIFKNRKRIKGWLFQPAACRFYFWFLKKIKSPKKHVPNVFYNIKRFWSVYIRHHSVIALQKSSGVLPSDCLKRADVSPIF